MNCIKRIEWSGEIESRNWECVEGSGAGNMPEKAHVPANLLVAYPANINTIHSTIAGKSTRDSSYHHLTEVIIW